MKTDTMLWIAAGVGAVILINSLSKKTGSNFSAPTGSAVYVPSTNSYSYQPVADSFAENIGQATGDTILDAAWGFVSAPYKWGGRMGWDLSNWFKDITGRDADILPYPEDLI